MTLDTAESGNGVTGMVLRIYVNDEEAEQKIKDERKAAVDAAKEARPIFPNTARWLCRP